MTSRAPVTILDEPMNGLDAAMRKMMYEILLKSHADHPRVILLSTHHIEEVQPICEDLIVLHEGSLVLHQSLEEIREAGFWLTGTFEKVDAMTAGEAVMERVEAGRMVKVMLQAPFSKDWQERARAEGLRAEKAKIQDYLLNITKEEEVPT